MLLDSKPAILEKPILLNYKNTEWFYCLHENPRASHGDAKGKYRHFRAYFVSTDTRDGRLFMEIFNTLRTIRLMVEKSSTISIFMSLFAILITLLY